jgi:fructan beta-fructosidase
MEVTMQRVMSQEARSRYLCLPVRREGALAKAEIRVDGQVRRSFDVPLTNGQPDFWVGADLGAFQGRQVELWVDDATLANAPVRQADAIPGTDDLYGERYRPQFHFTAARGWLNDPNGLVAYGGTYYLFFQHDPYANHGSGRNKHWGLATSHDLVHWREVGDALYPDALGACWSGSAVVDWRNSSGLGDGVTPPLVCAYTSAGEPFTQSLAFSADGGGTWQPYDGNPVVQRLRAENRDPKVIWHEPTECWIMALYLDGNAYALLRSHDLRRWELVQELTLEGATECPDFFPLALDGDPEALQWVFWGANGTYLVGSFDGERFTPTQAPARLAGSGDAYAAQTWSDIPVEDGRRIQIAWLRGDLPGMPFTQQLTFPHTLTLQSTERGMRLAAEPVGEIAGLYASAHRWDELAVSAGRDPLAGVEGDLLDVQARVLVPEGSGFDLLVGGVLVRYDGERETLHCDGRTCCCPRRDGVVDLRVLVDRASIELYGAGGLAVMPLRVLTEPVGRTLRAIPHGDEMVFRFLEVCTLRSIW